MPYDRHGKFYKALTSARRRRFMGTTGRKKVPRSRIYRQPNQRIGGFVGKEMKFVDYEVLNEPFLNTWTPMDPPQDTISGVTQGFQPTERIGRLYTIWSVHIRAHIQIFGQEQQPAPFPDLRGKLMCIIDSQSNNQQFLAVDVMDGKFIDDMLSFRNLGFVKRFRVIWDKQWLIRRNTQTNEGVSNLFATPFTSTGIWSFNKRFPRGLKVLCNLSGDGIGSIITNSIHIMGIANDPLALLTYQSRVRFTG